ncbi:CapA family protein [Anaeromicrobium sediminis]|uniref:Capsule synthesis protein CapA domain-containing protein n=1 Tax=Anaeromicrobium sediminis TaxID=1478221 RepID=A0A267MMW3_9FIRM|nr:CapA family protein [Anaeromicrobium sediminis]PAB60941.1 hypothetical protein CCE28_00475 [Anaeromicrobium sediminis]
MKKIISIIIINIIIISNPFTVYSFDESALIKEFKKKFEKNKEIDIVAVGDIMVHGPQLRAQYDLKNKLYSFEDNFKYIKKYIERADIALCNLETTLLGYEPYTSYPKFNSPDNLVDALKNSGFDIISTANNHSFDTKAIGMFRTVDVLLNKGLDVIGTRNDNYNKDYIIKEVKGVKVAFTSFTYETKKYGKNKTINGIVLPKKYETYINTFSYYNLENDLKKMEKIIKKMKKEKVDLIIFFFHWGNEYHNQPNEHQKLIAKKLSSYGVDIILGSHPHVIQPITIIKNEFGKETAVVYSMGNFLSNQRYENVKNRSAEDGIVVDFKIIKSYKGEVSIKKISYIPTWVYKRYINGKRDYKILPLIHNNNELKKLVGEEANLNRALNSRKNTTNLIEYNKGIGQIKVYNPLEDIDDKQ